VDELNRLIDQARFFGDLTAQTLELAGLGEGMRVLDAGCGAGDVSFLAAMMVGPTGSVAGIDRSAEAIELARRRAAQAGLTNVEFHVADLNELVLDEPVDALIGRLVLMYFADPAVTLRRLARHVKPGGIVAFHELNLDAATSEPACDVFESTIDLLRQAFRRAGVDARTGLKLGRVFEDAGLATPQMILGSRVERGPESPVYDQVAQITRTLLPLMERTGVATSADVGIETLTTRLRDEAVENGATLLPPAFVGAWSRTSGAVDLSN
jgi:SAM-dependent methyltransferase